VYGLEDDCLLVIFVKAHKRLFEETLVFEPHAKGHTNPQLPKALNLQIQWMNAMFFATASSTCSVCVLYLLKISAYMALYN